MKEKTGVSGRWLLGSSGRLWKVGLYARVLAGWLLSTTQLTTTADALGQDSVLGDAVDGFPSRNGRETDPHRLAMAYPEQRLEVVPNGIQWPDGTVMTFDDGREKSFSAALTDPDLQDQLALSYPKGRDYPVPPRNHDPGRIRYEPFFRKMYGDSALAVVGNLVPVIWLPKTSGTTVWVTRVNSVNEKLQAVSNELDQLAPDLKQFILHLGGAFYWRNVRGSQRLSAHSFGIAIDIDPRFADYWLWDKKANNVELIRYRNRIALEIVEIFERYGFIWGGKWYHYDTMHFEYRPELLIE